MYFYFWPLCCMFYFDIRILITSLVSSNSCTDLYIIVYNDVLLRFLFDTMYPFRHNANMILNVVLENVAITTKDPWL